MEKIRSGQSFLYRKAGYASTVIDVRMKDTVQGSHLNRALEKALQRYPYLRSKLVEKGGEFYLEENLLSLIAVRTKKSRVLGSMSTGYHLIDVTYYGNQICVSFHHSLCDGRGIKPFVETLIYYYCSFCYNKKLDSTNIHLAEEEILPDETDEPYGKDYFAFDPNNVFEVSKDGYCIPDTTEEKVQHYRSEININQKEFITFAKEHNATPAILLSMIVSSSIYKVHSDLDKPIVCSMATDYRQAIGKEHTHKNCVGSLYLPYSQETSTLSLSEQASMYRDLMKKQRTPDSIKSSLNMQVGLYNKLESVPSLEEKNKMMSFFDDLSINTYVISYLGQFNLDSCKDYLESIHLYSSGTKGLIFNMIAAGDYITVDILQHFESDEIVSAIKRTLDEYHISYSANERITFETKNDKAYLTASKQAERYYK